MTLFLSNFTIGPTVVGYDQLKLRRSQLYWASLGEHKLGLAQLWLSLLLKFKAVFQLMALAMAAAGLL